MIRQNGCEIKLWRCLFQPVADQAGVAASFYYKV